MPRPANTETPLVPVSPHPLPAVSFLTGVSIVRFHSRERRVSDPGGVDEMTGAGLQPPAHPSGCTH